MIFAETIQDMIIKDLDFDNPSMNVDHFKEVFEVNEKAIDEIRNLISKLVNKMKKDYYEYNMIGDNSIDWIINEFGYDNFNISLQEVINYRIDREHIHNSLDERKELYISEYQSAIECEPDFMSQSYCLSEKARNEINNWKLK